MSALAVPPVERISTPAAASARARCSRPVLSLTLTRARPMRAMGSSSGESLRLRGDAGNASADARDELVRDRSGRRRDLLDGEVPTPELHLVADSHARH